MKPRRIATAALTAAIAVAVQPTVAQAGHPCHPSTYVVSTIPGDTPEGITVTGNGTMYVTSVGTDSWQNGAVPATWHANKFGGSPSEIVIGWQSFSSATNDVWMDDLILSTSPIGCN